MASSNNKMKGLLKGLRYISEIFENEKEPEMQIGLPTDVKHVAHIGWDGPSAAVKSAPSWMNEFKSSPANNGEAPEEDPGKSVSQDGSSREGSRDQSSSATDMPEVPKSSKRSSTTTRSCPTGESAGKEKSDKPKHSKKSSKSSSTSKETSETATKPKKKPKEHKEPKDPNDPTDSEKKSSRRKKSKDSVEGSSRRSKTRDMDTGSESGSVAGI
ncbi:hypothetical protein HRI_004575100 [Hibiscus trionum]|uniref:CRIB domain-containing protein n=1 Tax=Hibiscus trionum TaxID=183268 RepID=A0A9W7JC81_HIBTR|nr:hypothetical protein HRI_004575100 [Hibiscus trionum]